MRSLAAITTAALAVAALAIPSAAMAAPVHWHSKCGAPVRANGRQSLTRIANFELASPVSQILHYSAMCGPDGNYTADVQMYLNAGDLRAPMPRGSRLWASAIIVTGG